MSIWGAAIGAGVSLLGGIKASNDAKDNAKVAKAENKESAIRQAGLDALDADYTNQWNEYTAYRKAAAKDRGMAEFRKFSTVGEFAPNYSQDYQREVINKPSLDNYMSQVGQVANTASGMSPTPSRGKGGILSKVVGALI